MKKIKRQCIYLYASCLLKSDVFRCFLNVSFSSTIQMPPGTLFQLMGNWYANAHCPYDLVLAMATLRIFKSVDEHSGLLAYTHSTALTDILDMQ